MYKISHEGDNLVITLPNRFVKDHFVNQFVDRLRMEQLIEKNQMTEDEAWSLSEEIKQEWWDKNEEMVMAKVKAYESNS